MTQPGKSIGMNEDYGRKRKKELGFKRKLLKTRQKGSWLQKEEEE